MEAPWEEVRVRQPQPLRCPRATTTPALTPLDHSLRPIQQERTKRSQIKQKALSQDLSFGMGRADKCIFELIGGTLVLDKCALLV